MAALISGAATFSTMTLSITTFSVMDLIVKLRIKTLGISWGA